MHSDTHMQLQPQVLVVDDSATTRVVIERQLKKLGCLVTVAHDGTSGLAAIEAGAFDLVLLDCQMPDISGYEVARTVRDKERQGGAHTPIIAISGDTDDDHLQLCFDSGMDGVLNKPLPLKELEKILALWCDVSAPSSSPAANSDVEFHTNLQGLFQVTALEDFSALESALQCADLRMIGRVAHRMKGAALTMNAAHIVTTLEEIEALASNEAKPAVESVQALTDVVSILRGQLQAI